MNGAFFAKTAVFFKLDSVGIVLFILSGVVIALLALGAFKRYSYVFRFHTFLRKVANKNTAKTVLNNSIIACPTCQAFYRTSFEKETDIK